MLLLYDNAPAHNVAHVMDSVYLVIGLLFKTQNEKSTTDNKIVV